MSSPHNQRMHRGQRGDDIHALFLPDARHDGVAVREQDAEEGAQDREEGEEGEAEIIRGRVAGFTEYEQFDEFDGEVPNEDGSKEELDCRVERTGHERVDAEYSVV